jgi:hypothetical protein
VERRSRRGWHARDALSRRGELVEQRVERILNGRQVAAIAIRPAATRRLAISSLIGWCEPLSDNIGGLVIPQMIV